MADFIIIAVVALVVGAAGLYIYKAKKSGAKCIGCSSAGCSCSCADQSGSCGGSCSGCNGH